MQLKVLAIKIVQVFWGVWYHRMMMSIIDPHSVVQCMNAVAVPVAIQNCRHIVRNKCYKFRILSSLINASSAEIITYQHSIVEEEVKSLPISIANENFLYYIIICRPSSIRVTHLLSVSSITCPYDIITIIIVHLGCLIV